MAKSTVSGLTVMIGADTKGFSDAFKQLDAEARNIAKDLKTVNDNLKLDPKNAEKAANSLDLLRQQAQKASEKVDLIKKAIQNLNKQYADGKISADEYNTSMDHLKILLSQAQHEQDLANEKIKQFGTNADDAGKKALSLGDIIKANLISDAIKSGLHAIADAAKAIGDAVWNALKDITKGIADFTKQGLSIAEENRQTLAKVGQVFGENAQQIVDWSKQAVDAFGLSSGKAQEAASVFGNMFVALGLNTDQASDMSMNMVQLAADIAAFNNVTTAQVLEDFQSMLAGTSRTVRKYGIVLTEAAVKEKAVAMGLAETTEDVDDAAKAQARYALMVEQTTHQEGQFARESSSATVQTQKLQARIEELQGSLGEKLIPVQARVYELLNNLLSNPAIMAFFDSVINKVGELSTHLAGILSDVNLDFDDLEGGFDSLLSQLVDKLMAVLPDIIAFGGDIVTSLVDGITQHLPLIMAEATPIVTELMTGLASAAPVLLEGALQLLTTLVDGIQQNLSVLAPVAQNIIMQLIQFIFDNLPSVVSSAIEIVLSLVNGISQALPELIPAAISMILEIVQTLLDHANDIVDAAFSLALSLAEGLLKAIPDIVAKLPQIIISLVDFFINERIKFIQLGIDLLTAIVQNLPEIIASILVGIAQIIAGIVNYFTDHQGDIVKAGEDLVLSLWNGIQNLAGWFSNNFTSWLGNIWSGIKNAFSRDAEESANDGYSEDSSSLGAYSGSFAQGGRPRVGRIARINDDAGHRPEVFIPDVPGVILNGDKTERLMNNINNSRTVGDVNIYVNSYGANAEEIADELGAAMNRKLRMSGAIL